MQSTILISSQASERGLPATLAGKAFLAIGATGLVALCAHISFPLYFTPVPVTLQTLAVILVGLVLGPSLGASAMVLYLAEGAMGLPVFSPHGPGGIAQLAGPTAGFLFSYPLAAAGAGSVIRFIRFDRAKFLAAIVAGIVASFFIFSIGAGWLAMLLHLGPGAAWHLGVAPFLPGEALKIIAAASAFTAFRRLQTS